MMDKTIKIHLNRERDDISVIIKYDEKPGEPTLMVDPVLTLTFTEWFHVLECIKFMRHHDIVTMEVRFSDHIRETKNDG